MAENSGVDKTSSDAASPPPPHNDWELLSMTSSMSSSMLGLPRSNLDIMPDLDIMPAPRDLQQNAAPAADQNSEPQNSDTDATAAAALPPSRHHHHLVDPSSSTSSITEPFADGWKPRHSVELFCEENSPEINSSKEALEEGQVAVEETGPSIFPDKDLASATGKQDRLVGLEKDIAMDTDKQVQAAEDDVPVVMSVSPHAVDKALRQDKRSKGRGKQSRWKRRAGLWIPDSSKSSTFLSVAVAAALFGICYMGHRWHEEWRRNQQLQIELSEKDEELQDLTKRMRDAFTGRRRVAGTKSWW